MEDEPYQVDAIPDDPEPALNDDYSQQMAAAELRRYRSLGPIVRAVLCYNLGSVYFGYTLVYFNAIRYESIHQIFGINLDIAVGQGLYSGLIELGAIIGAVASRFILKSCTRKQSFFIANIIAFVAGLFVLVQSMKTLLIGRLMQGATIGIFSSIVPLTVRELVPVQISGFMGSFFAPSVVLGSLLGYLIPYILSFSSEIKDYWMTSFSFSLVFVIAQQILLMTVFTWQTPKYLIRKGKIEEAKKIITFIYKDQYHEAVLAQKISELNITRPRREAMNQLPPAIVQPAARSNRGGDSGKPMREEMQKSLFWDEDTIAQYPRDIPKAKFLAFWMEIFQNLAGVYVVSLYGRQLAAVAMPDFKLVLPLLLNTWRLGMSISGVFLIRKFGRKQILIPGVAVMALGLLGLTIGYRGLLKEQNEWFVFFCLLIMIGAFAMSISPVTWLYIPQIIQPPLIPFTTIVNWVSASIIVFAFPIIQQDHEKTYVPRLFLFFFFCMVVHIVVLRLVMRETKLKTESQIREKYREPLKQACQRSWKQ